ncbi:WD40 repeat-like protein [Lentinula aciculospora]|uniref:WD40 repeat-like protein n=1 Tax=Lentinula aciculospora TaxID=153920 RepID=A0A9W9A830_9AGAR|nr:WD40 repeat-like protein [Lentinula aciculospora]
MCDATSPVAVHRCRFIDFDPSTITALAFPPLRLPSIKRPKHFSKYLEFGTLAIGRANGNIDMCEWTGPKNESQSKQAWVIRKTLPGLYPSKVDSLAFVIREPHTIMEDQVPSTSDLRLFSSGGGSELLEWDTESSTIRRTISSQGGTIWCVAANPAGTMLALGCEDGTIRLISVADDTLTHHKRFDRVKSRILSVAWGPPMPKENSSDEDDDDEWLDLWLVTGCSDSSLRKWDASTGRMLDRMGTDKIRGERTLVWAVDTLGDGTIVSGDSLGMVKFWDSRTCTQLQSFKSHGADVLCLTVGPDGHAIYSSGVDQKVVQYSRVKTSQGTEKTPDSKARWMQTSSRRMHYHDVRSLAMWPPYTPLPSSHKRQFSSEIAPVVASGGLDMSVVVTPAALPSSTLLSKVINPLSTSVHATFDDSYHRRLPYSSGPSSTFAIHIARHARLVSCMRDSRVSIWRILKKPSPLDDDDQEELPEETDTADWEKCVEMELDVHTNLVASAISDDGKWLVVSDLYETKLFRLIMNAEGQVKPRRIRHFASIISPHLPQKPSSTGGLSFAFTPDSTKLVMSAALTSYILVIDISEENPRVLRKFDHHRQRNNLSSHRVTKDLKTINTDVEMGSDEENSSYEDEDSPLLGNVTRMTISADGQWLATSDHRSRTHIFNLDSIQHHCVLPSFPLPAQSVAFSSSNPNLLVLAFPNNTFQIYDVETRQFPSWSREICDNLPKRFTHTHDPIIGVSFEPLTPGAPSQSSGRCALFWGSTWLCKISFDDGPVRSSGFSRKRRRESYKPQKNNPEGVEERHKELKMITQYRPVLFVDYLGPGELLVVERPLVDVLATLPPAYFRHKYGAS